MDPVKDLDR